MKTFLALNRQKLRFAFIACSFIGTCLFVIFSAVMYFKSNIPDLKSLLTVLLLAVTVFPAFIILIAYLEWYQKQALRKKAFSKNPFNQLENAGFHKSYINLSSKWFFTEEIKEGSLNGFKMFANVSRQSGRMIEFEVPVEWQQLDKTQYNLMSEKFRQLNAELRIGSLVKQYDTNRLTVNTIEELKSELDLFTLTLKQEKFEPLQSQSGI